ncbi:MAG: hypothetical protein JKY48_01395 [Flavobacteriales bacterium]|nr:hypothetical protein [Flavobacteriales bacterium]
MNPEAAKYKSDVKLMTKSFRKVFKDEKKELIYFTLWGLRNKRGDNHNNEKLLWDSLEYAEIYPNDRLLRHSAGSTYVMDKDKFGFVIVGLETYEEYLKKPIQLKALTDIAKSKFFI